MTSRSILIVLAAVLPIVAAAGAGQLATMPNLSPWYEGLQKPGFNPPNWIFGPVWTILYVLMGVAVWRIFQAPESQLRTIALTAFFVQLTLNAAWSWLFFARHSPLAGLIEIVPQWLSIVATIVLFARLDVIAALCLTPLALWVGFATLLNFAIWRLNG